MDLFNKANAAAKAAADKASEVVGDARLRIQILNDEKSIKELEAKIGAYYYKKFAAGKTVDDDILHLCTAISVHRENIKEKKAALNVEAAPRRAEEDPDPFEQP